MKTIPLAAKTVIFLLALSAPYIHAASEQMTPVTIETKAPIEFFEPTKPGALPADVLPEPVDIKSSPMIAPAGTPVIMAPEKEEKESTDAEGRRTIENFERGFRTQMRKFDARDNLVESWTFEKENGRIQRYAKYAYGKEGLESYRVSEWTYDRAGDSAKVSRNFDSKNELAFFSVEYFSAAGTRYCEQWFDAEGALTAQKIWDRDTGAFKQHVIVKPYLNSKKIQWLDENKEKIREVVVPASNGPLSRILFGKHYDTGFKKMRTKDRLSYRETLSQIE